ncbi:WecB/TagA/CpsF family glycosyltransferase [Methylobacterium oxalidis]|uniref:WecB/TagA/CpsF family glycosyltransferase n=1 Tax=Methylobacterium oxalidis TaxID=944322 RepID=UPI003314D0D1
MKDAVDLVLSRLSAQTRQSVYFVNAHGLYLAMRDAEYREIVNTADVVFADGTGARWAARRQGTRLRDNVNGTDLVPLLLSSKANLKVFLVGGLPERVWAMEEGFRTRFPNCRLVGVRDGYVGKARSQGLVEAINAAQPDLLLVGMGNPLQERWISENRRRLEVPCVVAVGGLFQYWTGDLDRAPRWMRRAGIEWLHIVIHQPRKLHRYFVLGPLFLLRAFLFRPVVS